MVTNADAQASKSITVFFKRLMRTNLILVMYTRVRLYMRYDNVALHGWTAAPVLQSSEQRCLMDSVGETNLRGI